MVKLIVLSLLLFPTIALGIPEIDSVSGTWNNGETVTITGSGFGTKTPAAPIFYSDFEHGSNGSTIHNGSAATIGTYYTDSSNYPNGPGVMPTFSSVRTRPGSSLSGRSNFTDSWKSLIGSSLSGAYDEVYTEVWINYDECDPLDQFQAKTLRIYPGGHGYPNFTSGWWCRNATQHTTGGGVWETGPGDCGDPDPIPGGTRPPDEDWGHWQTYLRHSTPGSEDGVMQFWMQGAETLNNTTNLTRGLPGNGCSTALMQLVEYGNYLSGRNEPDQGCPAVDCDAYMYWDNMYIDNTRARIEIGSSPIYGITALREIQIPSRWDSDGQTIEFTVNVGAFEPGEPAHLFVIDSNGNISDGKVIVIGEGENNNATMASPKNITVSQ